jgi:hypothetical protein
MKKPSGKFIKCAGYESFRPDSLPPEINCGLLPENCSSSYERV